MSTYIVFSTISPFTLLQINFITPNILILFHFLALEKSISLNIINAQTKMDKSKS